MRGASVDPVSEKFERLNEWMWERAGVVLGPGLLFVIVRVVLDFAGRFHWILELLITLLLAVLLALILASLRGPMLKRLRTQHPLRVTIGVFLFVTLLAVTVFSALSVLLWKWQSDSYSGATAYTPGKFADFYFWHLLESLPGLSLMSTYEIPAPIAAHGAAATTLVLLFRALVIVRLLAVAGSWFRLEGRQAESAASGA